MGKSRRHEGDALTKNLDFTKKRQRQTVNHSLRGFANLFEDEEDFEDWYDDLDADALFEDVAPIRKKR